MREQIFFERLEVGMKDEHGLFFYDKEWKCRGDMGLRQGRYSIGWNERRKKLVFLRWRRPEGGSIPHPEWPFPSNVTPVSKQMEKILRAIMWPNVPEDFIPNEGRQDVT